MVKLQPGQLAPIDYIEAREFMDALRRRHSSLETAKIMLVNQLHIRFSEAAAKLKHYELITGIHLKRTTYHPRRRHV